MCNCRQRVVSVFWNDTDVGTFAFRFVWRRGFPVLLCMRCHLQYAIAQFVANVCDETKEDS